nr:integrase, catalytic region, zinc finger, CCHC-type, peptidase aspartic, catalytic [Tanacetum cinerariifolium]
MSQDNTKKNRIRRTQRKAKKNKVEYHLRTVKSILNKKSVVDSKATSSTFTLVGNVCPLIRIATTTIVPPKEPSLIVHTTDKPVVTLVYSKKPKAANKKVPTLVTNKMEPNSSWGSSSSNVSSPLIDCRNVTISRVYYVEGLGYNLFSVGQFCDSDLEVAFCQHTCFTHNLDGVDLLTGSRGNNLYTLSLQDMMASSPICLLSKASKTKSWLWHRRLPMRVESVNGKNYILVIVDDYSRFTWVKFLRSKDETPDFIIKFLKMIQVRLNVPVQRIRTDNGTEFVNQTLHDYYEEVGISYETSVARSPQQNGSILGPALNDMTPGTISSGLVHTTSSSTSYVPPSRNDWDLLFQSMFDELLNPPPSVVNQAAEVIAPFAKVIPQVDADSTGSPSSTPVDQDAPSQSKSLTTTEIQSIAIPQDVRDDNFDMEVAHMGNDPLLGVPIPEV